MTPAPEPGLPACAASGCRSVTALITLYTAPGCHLCERARSALLRLRAEHRFELQERDITLDDDLHRAYLERIPVICLDGEELFDYFVDEDMLRARLESLH
jgi:glutaredoxin